MIKLNGNIIEKKHFPAGEQSLLDIEMPKGDAIDEIEWYYDNDEELTTLIFLVRHLRNTLGASRKIKLFMPYVPHARMDRTHADKEVFTLKYVAEIINSLRFEEVTVFDAHSNVCLGLLNNVRQMPVGPVIGGFLQLLKNDGNKMDPILYFPDDGALKRYKDMPEVAGYRKLYGKKIRNWETHRIEGLDIYTEEGDRVSGLPGETVIMIDDIVSYGGTMAYSADKLKELGAEHIGAYASHTETAVLDEARGTLIHRLENGTVEQLITTDSIYRGTHPRITPVRIKNPFTEITGIKRVQSYGL